MFGTPIAVLYRHENNDHNNNDNISDFQSSSRKKVRYEKYQNPND